MTLSLKKTLLHGFLKDVWAHGCVESVDKYLSDTYSIQHDPGDPWEGQTLTHEGFKDRLTKSRAMAPDQAFTVVKMIEVDDCVAVAWTWCGTHSGGIPGFPATGRAITMSGLTMYSFKDNRLSGHWQVADRLSVFQQLSLPQ